jgi:iron(III) transport system substrate-binding protein
LLPVVLLAACGSDAPTSASSPTTVAPAGGAKAGGAATAAQAVAEVAALHLSEEKRLAYLYRYAAAEGSVLLYSSLNLEVLEPLKAKFDAAFPRVRADTVKLDSAALLERVRAERAAGHDLFDVAAVDVVTGTLLHHEGIFVEDLRGATVPDGYPTRFVDPWTVSWVVIPNVLSWNTDAFESDPPSEIDDLLEPAYKGCAISPTAQSFAAGLIVERGYAKAEAWFRGFFANGGTVAGSQSSLGMALASGEERCAADLFATAVEGLKSEDGAPVDWHAPTPTAANITGTYLARRAPHPYAAALFQLWMLGRDGAQVVADSGRLSANPDVHQRYAGLAPFLKRGTSLEKRLVPITPAVAERVGAQAQKLVETYVLAHAVGR